MQPIVSSLSLIHILPTIVTNCSNNYGPYQFPEKLIPLFINNIRHRKPLQMCIRDSTKVRVTNVKPGLVETNFSNIRFHGDHNRADNVYRGIEPLNGDDGADVAFYAASAPEHVQIAEVLVLATHQANGTVDVYKRQPSP